jgi:PAS domain S-box-containing protein
MSMPVTATLAQPQLRHTAETRLKEGTAPPAHYATVSADALMLLYKLASDPERAREGLGLLHELQVHQVELDLQKEQLEINEQEIAEALARYTAIFDFAPSGYFIVDAGGHIREANRAGATLLGVAQADLVGQSIDSFLASENRQTLTSLFRTLHGGATSAGCSAQVWATQQAGNARRLHISASMAPGIDAVLMIVCESSPAS